MKDIYDIIRLISTIKIVGLPDIRFSTKNFKLVFLVSPGFYILSVKQIGKRYSFYLSIPKINSYKIEIEKPNSNDDGYKKFEFDYSFLEDIKIMDEIQLVLSYGRFCPDYLSGDLTEMYSCLYDNLLSEGYVY